MDNKCSETPASRSLPDNLLWYAIGIDGSSSIRIQQSLIVGELNDGTLILKDETVSVEKTVLADESSSEPGISLRINECNELILESANACFDVFADNEPRRRYSLKSGDQIKLPNNQFFVSNSLFGEPVEGRIIEIKAVSSGAFTKFDHNATKSNEVSSLLKHPLIVNESAVREREKRAIETLVRVEEIPQLASIIADATENPNEQDVEALPSQSEGNAGFHWKIAIAASVFLTGLSLVLLFSLSFSGDENVLLAEASTQPLETRELERDSRQEEQEGAAVQAAEEGGSAKEGLSASEIPSQMHVENAPAIMADTPISSLNVLKESMPGQAPYSEELEVVDLLSESTLSGDITAYKIDSDAKSVWAEAYLIKGNVATAPEGTNLVEEIEIFEEPSEVDVQDDRLVRAKEKLARGDIVTPIGKSAVTYLSWYLSENPEDNDAKHLLKLCAQKLVEQAVDDYAHNKTYEARNTLEEVFAFDPYNEHALALWKGWHGQPWSGS